jgi:orotidine-5'-phosphate decarboxylase
MITVHTTAGIEVLQGAVKGAEERAKELHIDRPYIVGVTLLTSEKIETDTLDIVLNRARSAKEAGLDGVVCSALEAKKIREEFGNEFIIVTPGIRSDNSSKDDQKRTATVIQAVEAGSNFLVIGRPILKAEDPLAAAEEFLGDLHK